MNLYIYTIPGEAITHAALTHLISDEIHLAVLADDAGKGTLLLMKLKEHPKTDCKETNCH